MCAATVIASGRSFSLLLRPHLSRRTQDLATPAAGYSCPMATARTVLTQQNAVLKVGQRTTDVSAASSLVRNIRGILSSVSGA